MPKITAVCLTLGRPHLLAQMIRQFQLQTYQDRWLHIIDTGNHIEPQSGDRWDLRQLGRVDTAMWATMNELIRETDSELVIKMDDDDGFLPWHISAHVEALDGGMWACPSVVYDNASAIPGAQLVMSRTCGKSGWANVCYAGTWSYARSAFESVGGYPDHGINEGECEFRDLLFAKYGPPVDTISERFPQPSYVYRRGAPWQASLLQRNPEETMRQRTMKREPVGKLVPMWPEKYIEGLPTDGTIQDRPW